MFNNAEKDYLVESARAVPSVSGCVFSYVTLNNFVAVHTIIYIRLYWKPAMCPLQINILGEVSNKV